MERVTERALEALLERNVAVSLYTRSWPQTRLQLVEPLVVDPFHMGALWRDWSFARAACRDVRRSQPNLVESHERCCAATSTARATECTPRGSRKDGSTRRRRGGSRRSSRRTTVSSRDGKAALRIHLAACGDLQFEDGQGRDPPALRGSGIEAPRHLQPGGRRRLPSRAARGRATRPSSAIASMPRRPSSSWPPSISPATTSAPRSMRSRSRAPRRTWSSWAMTTRRRAFARARARGAAIASRSSASMPTGGPITAPPMCSCCPRSTILRRTSRSRRWPPRCP